jgi:5-formyltetrahydrofolate cyclo-ligase
VQPLSSTLRRQALDARKRLAPSRIRQNGLQIALRLGRLPEFRRATTVGFYVATASEAPTAPAIRLAHRLGKRVFLPRLAGKSLEFAEWQMGKPLTHNRFSIPEPQGKAVAPTQIDLYLCPLAAFDVAGHRLGMGGGFYDRYLAHCHASSHIVGLAHAIQKLAPWRACPWDINLDAVITEAAVHRFSPRRNQYQHHRKRHTFD